MPFLRGMRKRLFLFLIGKNDLVKFTACDMVTFHSSRAA